ncbi:TauD/TfdA family dioxygenase [Sorangium sp. So ce136]|uniref:TauD/TfdA dioxygenase family protein n=1 Tax=Sorangium sp. So ce136 TaxID=3133284 RepID=UPI003EFDDDA0
MSLVLTATAERPPTFHAVEVRRHTPLLGATVTGVDLSREVDAATAARLRHALREHGVLFFREQHLTPRRFLDVASVFGEPLRHNPYIPSVQEHSGVEIIESGAGKRILANEAWHADVTWRPDPPKATALYAVELPPLGGDTVWTSATGAYASLDPLLAAYLETLTAVNFVDASGHARTPGRDERLDELRAKYPPIDVPVIKTHPETGQKYVFVTELHTTYIKGVSRTTSESLLRLLFGVLADPVLHARFSWRPGSLAIWDNRLVQHRAIHDYGDQRRVLYRATLA